MTSPSESPPCDSSRWRLDVGEFFCQARVGPAGVVWEIGTNAGESSAYFEDGVAPTLEEARNASVAALRLLMVETLEDIARKWQP